MGAIKNDKLLNMVALLSTIFGFVGMHVLSLLPDFRDWAETDLLHGHAILVITLLGAALVVADPFRSHRTVQAFPHGIVFGICSWWLVHFLAGADLLSRNDWLFIILASGVGGILAGRLVFSPWVTQTLFREALRHKPRGERPLLILKLLSGVGEDGNLDNRPGKERSLFRFLRVYSRIRCLLGFGPARCHALERAFERSLDTETSELRAALDRGAHTLLEIRVSRVAKAAAAELEMTSLVLGNKGNEILQLETWPARALKAWELVRHAERVSGCQFKEARAELLLAIERFSSEGSWLRRASSTARQGALPMHLLGQLDTHCRTGMSAEHLLACVLAIDFLVQIKLGTWALRFLNGAAIRSAPPWIQPAIERIRLEAEAQLLKHEESLEEADVYVRRSRHSQSMLGADAPELSHGGRTALVFPLREAQPIASCRTTKTIPGLIRKGLDKGPAATVIAAIVALLTVVIADWHISTYPIGKPYKSLKQLSGSVQPAGRAITDAESHPNEGRLFMTTMGGGLHELNTDTFRLRSWLPGRGGPSSSWLSKVALSSTGEMAVITRSSAVETNANAESGIDVRVGNGWHTIIPAVGIFNPEAAEIKCVSALGRDKLLAGAERLMVYRSSARELVELHPKNKRLASEGNITALAGSAGDDQRAYVAVRRPDESSQVYELHITRDNHYELQDVTGSFPSTESVLQMVYANGVVWVHTASGRLYERTDTQWRLRLDGNTGLNLQQVAHVLIAPGDPAALWLTERDERGQIRSIRARLIPTSDVFPPGPWRHFDLTPVLQRSNNVQVTRAELKLELAESPPVALFDAERKVHTLLVPGAKGGLWRFVCPAESSPSPSEAKLEVEFIGTPEEKVIWLDALDDELLMVLEAVDGSARRVATCAHAYRLTHDVTGLATMLRTVLPDSQILGGSEIVCALNDAERGLLHLVLDQGRVISYDLRMHGLTSRQGLQLVDESGTPIGSLRSADGLFNRLLVVDSAGRVLEGDVRLAGNGNLGLKVVHQAGAAAPPADEDPVKLATESSGMEIFFAKPGSNNAWPWFLGPNTRTTNGNQIGPAAIMTWKPPGIRQALRLDSLTRLQYGGEVGVQIALNEDGQLQWRNAEDWQPVDSNQGHFDNLIAAVGGSFAQSKESLSRLTMTDGRPAVGEKLWWKTGTSLKLPATCAAGLRTLTDELIVGHAGGLARYLPGERIWKPSGILSNSVGDSTWLLYGADDLSGKAAVVWAAESGPQGILRRLFHVTGESLRELNVPAGSDVAGVGGSLSILKPNGELGLFSNDGEYRAVMEPKDDEVGDVELKRIVGDQVLYALDDRGRLLTATAQHMRWKTRQKETQAFRDLEVGADGRLALISSDGEVMAETASGLKRLGAQAERLQRVGSHVAAISYSSGRLGVIRSDEATVDTVAGGRDASTQIGEKISCMLADGDSLYLGGKRGAVLREPGRLICVGIEDGAGVDRMEKLDRHIIAWKSGNPFILGHRGGKPLLQTLGPRGSQPMLGPDGKIWLAKRSQGLAPTNLEEPAAREGIFRGTGRLEKNVSQAAKWGESAALLQGEGGALLQYNLMTRSLVKVSKGEDLSGKWRFLKSGTGVAVQVTNVQSRSSRLYQVIGKESASLELLEPHALSVLEYGGGVAWINQDEWSVHLFGADQENHRLLRISPPITSLQRAIAVSQALVAPDASLWGLAGNQAIHYSPASMQLLERVPNIKSLVQVADQVVGVIAEPQGKFSLVELSREAKPTHSGLDFVRGGERGLIGWRLSQGVRQLHIAGEQAGDYRQQIALPVPLRVPAFLPVAAPEGKLQFWLSSAGEIITYDVSRGAWIQNVLPTQGWEELGVMGNKVVALKRNHERSEVAMIAGGQAAVEGKEIPGQAWFTSNALVVLKSPSQDEQIVALETAQGEQHPLINLRRTMPAFESAHSYAFESSNSTSTLLFVRPTASKEWSPWLVRRGGHSQAIKGFLPQAAPDSLKVYEADDLLYVLDAGRITEINPRTAIAKVQAEEIIDVGCVDGELWYLQRETGTENVVRLRRAYDGFTAARLGKVDWHGDERQVKSCRFVTIGDRFAVAVETFETTNSSRPQAELIEDIFAFETTPTPSNFIQKIDRPPETVALVAQRGGFAIRLIDSPSQLAEPRSALPARSGGDDAILVQGEKLFGDGWFASQYLVSFGSGSGWTNRIPLVMRDGSVMLQEIGQPASPRPVVAQGHYLASGQEVRDSASGIRFGTIPRKGGVFPCDDWVDACPASEKEFYCLDRLGQLWVWRESNSDLVRELVRLPPTVSEVTGFRLPQKPDGSLLLVGPNKQVVARLLGGHVSRLQAANFVETPAERDGGLQRLNWNHSAGGNYLEFNLMVTNGVNSLSVPIQFTGEGLNIDHPIGLTEVRGDTRPWLHLANLADGRHLICPAEPDGVARLAQARVVSEFESSVHPAGFSLGPFSFSPKERAWTVSLNNTDVPVSGQGLLAVDDIRSATTITSLEGTKLYLATALPGVLVVQKWPSTRDVGEPSLLNTPGEVEELRTWHNQLYARFAEDQWKVHQNGEWRDVNPNWSANRIEPTKWSFDPAKAELSWDSEVVSCLNGSAGFALSPDALSNEQDAGEASRVRAGANGALVYQAQDSSWYIWNSGQVIARRAGGTLPPAFSDKLTLSNFSLPRRATGLKNYSIRQSDGNSAELPLLLRGGRMPHQQVVSIESWGSEGVVATLAANYGFLIYSNAAAGAGTTPIFAARSQQAAQKTRDYASHTGMELSAGRWLAWQKSDDSLRFTLASSSTGVATMELGILTGDGLPIDDPARVKPVEVVSNRINFVFQGQVCTREFGPSLDGYWRQGIRSNAWSLGPVVDKKTGRIVLDVVGQTTALADPMLGPFSSTGRWSPDRHFSASLDHSVSPGRLRLQKSQPVFMDLDLVRGDAGWIMPFQEPLGAAFAGERVLILGSRGNSVGVWSASDRQLLAEPVPTPISRLWRAGGKLFGQRSGSDYVEVSFDSQGGPRLSDVARNSLPLIEFTTDAFGLRREFEKLVLQPVWRARNETAWRNADNWVTNGLPGSWIEGVGWIQQDSVALQDRHGIRHFGVSAARLSPITPADNSSKSLKLLRHFGALKYGGVGSGPRLIDAQSGDDGIRFVTPQRESCVRTQGMWAISQSWHGSAVKFGGLIDGMELDLGDSQSGMYRGGLLIDRPTGLFLVGGNGLLALPCGVKWMNQGQMTPARDPETHRLLSAGRLNLSVYNGLPCLFDENSSGKAIALDASLKPIEASLKLHKYEYFGGEGDWQMFYATNGELVLERTVRTESGMSTDRLVGQEMFAGGQFAFDKVIAVSRDPGNSSSLLFVTARTTERVLAAPDRPICQVVSLENKVNSVRWHTIPVTGERQWAFEWDGDQVALPADHRDATLQLTNSLTRTGPLAFAMGKRVWVVLSDQVQWVEADARWKEKRRRELSRN